MNVLVLSPTFYPDRGGAESLADDLVRLFVSRGHGVTVLRDADDPAAAAGRRHGADVIALRCPPPLRRPSRLAAHLAAMLAYLYRQGRIIRERRIDVVWIARIDERALYPALLRPLLRFRLVGHLHGGELRKFGKERPAFGRALRAALSASDAVVAISDDLGREAAALSPAVAGKVTVIPNAVEVPRIRGVPAATRPRPYVLFAGRLVPVKNVRALIEAFARARRVPQCADLVIAGSGPEQPALEELATLRGVSSQVVFLGSREREDVFALMRGALLVVLPSYAEGHPLVLLEAAAAGRMVLASAVKGNRDVLARLGHGVAFEPDDHERLARLLETYVGDAGAREALAANAGRADPSAFDIGGLVERLLAVLAVR